METDIDLSEIEATDLLHRGDMPFWQLDVATTELMGHNGDGTLIRAMNRHGLPMVIAVPDAVAPALIKHLMRYLPTGEAC